MISCVFIHIGSGVAAMNISARKKRLAFLLSTSFLCLFPQVPPCGAQAVAAGTDTGSALQEARSDSGRVMTREYDPVEVKGTYLEPFLGTPLSRFRLLAWREGRFVPVPFQIDERTPGGEMVLPLVLEGETLQGDGRLDARDMLVFMGKDAGRRAGDKERARLTGSVLELEIRDPLRGEKGYLYLQRLEDEGVREDPEPRMELVGGTDGLPYSLNYLTGTLRGRVNRIRGKTYQTPLTDYWVCRPEAGGSGEDLLDALKVRIKVGFLFNTLKISLDETSILGGMEALRAGPVRCFGRFWMQGVLPLGIRSPRAYMDVYLYDTMVLVPGRIRVFVNPGYVMSSFSVTVGYDMSEKALGMRFYNSNNPEGFLIDGRMDGHETKMDTSLDEWRAAVGPQGAVITASVWDERYQEQAEIEVGYLDDRESPVPPEKEPGSIGFHFNTSRVKGLKPGTYDMLLCWFFPDRMYDPERFRSEVVDAFMDIRRNPLEIRIGEQVFSNPAGWPPRIAPD